MKNKIFLLFIFCVENVYSSNSTSYYDEYEALGSFLQLKTSISEFDICENGITRCNDNGYISYLEFDLCWKLGEYNTKYFPFFSQLKNLVIIGTYNNKCSTKNKLPKIIFKLPNLENIIFINVKDEDFPKNINQESFVKNIEIKDSKFKIFPTQLTQLKNLNLLRITQSYIEEFPKQFAEFPSLKELELDGNNYGDKRLVIPNTIKYLDVSNEGFTSLLKDDFKKELIALICDNTKNNNIDNNNDEIITSSEYYNIKKIINIINENEEISSKNFDSIISIKNEKFDSSNITLNNENDNENLNSKSISFEFNNFDEDIFSNITNYKNLIFLYLENNNLIKKIPSSIKELTSLELLKLNYENIDEVSEEFFKHPKLKKRLELKNKELNPGNLTSFKRCDYNKTMTIPCFEYSINDNDKDNKSELFIIIGGTTFFTIIIIAIACAAYKSIRKRNKFEKMRKKIIENATNDIDKTYTRKLHYSLTDFLKNSFNPQNNIFNTQVNEAQSNSSSNEEELESNVNDDNNNIAIDVHNNTNNDENIESLPLPTYQESITRGNINNNNSNNNHENEKNNIESIVAAEALNQTVEEYYERVIRGQERNPTDANPTNTYRTNTENDHAVAEAVNDNEKVQNKNNEKKEIEKSNKNQIENMVDAEALVQTREEYYSRVQRRPVNETNSNSVNSQESNENDQMIAETINENETKKDEDIKKGNIEDIVNIDDTEPLPSYDVVMDENKQESTESIILENDQNNNEQKINIIDEIVEDNQKEHRTENEATKINTPGVTEETKNNTETKNTTDSEEARNKSTTNNIINIEPPNLEKLNKQTPNNNIHIVPENEYVYPLSTNINKNNPNDTTNNNIEPCNLKKLSKQTPNNNIHIVRENEFVYPQSTNINKNNANDENKNNNNKKNI